MPSDPRDDEDAFRWEGDDSPTRPPRPERADTSLPTGWHAVGKGSEPHSAEPAAEPAAVVTEKTEPPASLGNVALVSLGLLGGIYLLYTVGWLLGGSRTALVISPFLAPSAVVPAQWLAVAAPVLWFGATMLLTRASATWVRFVWLVIGVFLLLPWPFVSGV
ncbi:DNA polymerase III subunit gamma/tau [Microbacterium sp. MM2322]|uniref:DNA polymerase III subunit gamma/tau n=1 Tax=Microbacterium sp. MM2322 TaxID=3157631 RepID=UPI0032D58618